MFDRKVYLTYLNMEKEVILAIKYTSLFRADIKKQLNNNLFGHYYNQRDKSQAIFSLKRFLSSPEQLQAVLEKISILIRELKFILNKLPVDEKRAYNIAKKIDANMDQAILALDNVNGLKRNIHTAHLADIESYKLLNRAMKDMRSNHTYIIARLRHWQPIDDRWPYPRTMLNKKRR